MMKGKKYSNHMEPRNGCAFLFILSILPVGISAKGSFAFRNYEQRYRTEVDHQLIAIAELKIRQVGVLWVVTNEAPRVRS